MSCRAIVALALAAACAACAAHEPPVLGRTVSVARRGGERVVGELVAVQDSDLVVRRSDGVAQVPLADVRAVEIKRHDWGRSRGLAWSLLGGAATGAALAASCASVSSGCGGVGAAVLATWLVVGGLSSLSMEASSRVRLSSPSAESLRPYARFPQGLPPGLDDDSLVPPGLRRKAEPGPASPAGPPR
jgi:hypothetical protein